MNTCPLTMTGQYIVKLKAWNVSCFTPINIIYLQWQHFREDSSKIHPRFWNWHLQTHYEWSSDHRSFKSTSWVCVSARYFRIHNISDDSSLSFTGRCIFYISLTARQHKAVLHKQLSRHGRKLPLRIPEHSRYENFVIRLHTATVSENVTLLESQLA